MEINNKVLGIGTILMMAGLVFAGGSIWTDAPNFYFNDSAIFLEDVEIVGNLTLGNNITDSIDTLQTGSGVTFPIFQAYIPKYGVEKPAIVMSYGENQNGSTMTWYGPERMATGSSGPLVQMQLREDAGYFMLQSTPLPIVLRATVGVMVSNGATSWYPVNASNFNDMVADELEKELFDKTKKAIDFRLERTGDKLDITHAPKTIFNQYNASGFYPNDETGELEYIEEPIKTSVNIGEGVVWNSLQISEILDKINAMESETCEKDNTYSWC